jgi:hypothetical protein
MTTDTDYHATAMAIADRLIEGQYTGAVDYDAGEFFDVDAWEGYRMRSYLSTYCIERETMEQPGVDGIEGTIVVIDPDGGTVDLTVSTNEFGDTEIM